MSCMLPKNIGRYSQLEIHVAQSNKLPTLVIYGGRQGSNPVSPNTHSCHSTSSLREREREREKKRE